MVNFNKILTVFSVTILMGGWSICAAEMEQAPDISKFGKKTQVEIEEPKTVIRVNDGEITNLDILGLENSMMPGAMVHGSVSDIKKIEIRRDAIERLIKNQLMFQEAKKAGLVASKKEIEKEIKELRKRYRKNKTTLEERLKESKLTMDGLKIEIEKNILIDKIKKSKNEEFKAKAAERWPDSYLEAYYNAEKDKFQIPESTRLRNILIKVEPGSDQDTWAQARAKCEEIMKEIKSGKDFAELAKEFSQDMYAAQGGDMGLGHQGSIIPEVEVEADKLKTGEIAGPIWSIFGFHIIKLEERIPPLQLTFEQVKDNLKKDREQFEIRKLTGAWISNMKKEAKIEYLNDEDKKLMGIKEDSETTVEGPKIEENEDTEKK